MLRPLSGPPAHGGHLRNRCNGCTGVVACTGTACTGSSCHGGGLFHRRCTGACNGCFGGGLFHRRSHCCSAPAVCTGTCTGTTTPMGGGAEKIGEPKTGGLSAAEQKRFDALVANPEYAKQKADIRKYLESLSGADRAKAFQELEDQAKKTGPSPISDGDKARADKLIKAMNAADVKVSKDDFYKELSKREGKDRETFLKELEAEYLKKKEEQSQSFDSLRQSLTDLAISIQSFDAIGALGTTQPVTREEIIGLSRVRSSASSLLRDTLTTRVTLLE